MNLPVTDREVYVRNPLAEVWAQLRFPPILRIETEIPAEFQDKIRGTYALYQRALPAGELPPKVPAAIRNLIQGIGAAAGPVQHVFESQDHDWSVVLSRECLSVKTVSYSRWEEFRDRVSIVAGAFVDIYRPSAYSRVGLRYVDVVRRSILRLNDVSWSELLRPEIGGELTASEFGEDIDSMSRQLHCKLDGDNGFLTLKTGIALAEPGAGGGPKEKCFLIDSDFHTHRPTELNNVFATLDAFHRASGNLFRWAILPRLRDALGPQPLQ
jgi:uncharacterized protein (TIGR04255 family)